jgi:hypothetical protein
LWVFTTNRTFPSLRGNTRRKLAREGNRRAMDSPPRNQRVGNPSPIYVVVWGRLPSLKNISKKVLTFIKRYGIICM